MYNGIGMYHDEEAVHNTMVLNTDEVALSRSDLAVATRNRNDVFQLKT